MDSKAVDHPAHYGGEDDPYETIKVLEHRLSLEEFCGFCKGNAWKYIDRAGKKDAGKRAEDLQKAGWYINRLADYLENIVRAK